MARASEIPAERIPVTVIGGYLGTGKTTLINRLLADDHGLRLAVLVNDFGEINIDADLIAEHDGQTLALTNGCVCCSIADDLGGALAEISTLAPRADHIVLEASGVADPGRIANYAFGQPGLALDGVIVLADCETFESRSTDRFVGATVRRQLSAADILVLTKTGLVGEEQARQAMDRLRRDHPRTPVILIGDQAFRWEAILGVGTGGAGLAGGRQWSEFHDDIYATATWRSEQPLDRNRFHDLLRSKSNVLLRCKGWVRFADNPEALTLVQMVGGRVALIEQQPSALGVHLGLSFIFLRECLSVQGLYDMVVACQMPELLKI